MLEEGRIPFLMNRGRAAQRTVIGGANSSSGIDFGKYTERRSNASTPTKEGYSEESINTEMSSYKPPMVGSAQYKTLNNEEV